MSAITNVTSERPSTITHSEVTSESLTHTPPVKVVNVWELRKQQPSPSSTNSTAASAKPQPTQHHPKNPAKYHRPAKKQQAQSNIQNTDATATSSLMMDNDGFVKVVHAKQSKRINAVKSSSSAKESNKKKHVPNKSTSHRDATQLLSEKNSPKEMNSSVESEDDKSITTLKNDDDANSIQSANYVSASVAASIASSDNIAPFKSVSMPTTPLKIVKVNTRTEHIIGKSNKDKSMSINLGIDSFPALTIQEKSSPLNQSISGHSKVPAISSLDSKSVAWTKTISLSKELSEELQLNESSQRIELVEKVEDSKKSKAFKRKQFKQSEESRMTPHSNESSISNGPLTPIDDTQQVSTFISLQDTKQSTGEIKSNNSYSTTLPVDASVNPVSFTSAPQTDHLSPEATNIQEYRKNNTEFNRFGNRNDNRRGMRGMRGNRGMRGAYRQSYTTYPSTHYRPQVHDQFYQPHGYLPETYYQIPMYQQQLTVLQMQKTALLQQVEYYFSIENLIKDMWFRGNMNASGFVALNVIEEFRRVKSIIDTIRSETESAMDVLKQVVEKSTICEVVGDSIRLRNGWEYWVLPKTSSDDQGRAE